jgi:hypothetical protein
MLIFDEQFAYDFSLILMYLLSWTERQGQAPRFWKGFRFEILEQFEGEGLIQDSRRAKSAYLTEAGVRRARELLTRYGWASARGSRSSARPTYGARSSQRDTGSRTASWLHEAS